MQNMLPREALSEGYVLDGVFAMAALDMCMLSGTPNSGIYLQAALEYTNRGSGAFREKLCAITPENSHLLYLYSVITAIVNLINNTTLLVYEGP